MRRVASPLPWFFLLALAASGPAAAQNASPAFAPSEENPEDLPEGPGRDETFYACTACHNFKLVAAQGMTRPQWDDTLTFMTERHDMPDIRGDERERILDYLAQAFPPRRPSGHGTWTTPFAPQ